MRSRIALVVAAVLVVAAGHRRCPVVAPARGRPRRRRPGGRHRATRRRGPPRTSRPCRSPTTPPRRLRPRRQGPRRREGRGHRGRRRARRRHRDGHARRHLDAARWRAVVVRRAGHPRRGPATAGRSPPRRPARPGTRTSRPGRRFRLERTFGERGDLLDRDGKPLMPLGTVHAVQIDPVNATPESAAALEPIVGAAKGSLTQALAKATASGSKAPIPVITYRDSDWAPRQDRIEGAQGRHRADVRAAAGPHAHLRPAPARQLRRGDRRDDQEQRRPLRGG